MNLDNESQKPDAVTLENNDLLDIDRLDKRVFALYVTDPTSKESKTRAKKLEKSWEKLHGKNTCHVVVLALTEKLESLY